MDRDDKEDGKDEYGEDNGMKTTGRRQRDEDNGEDGKEEEDGGDGEEEEEGMGRMKEYPKYISMTQVLPTRTDNLTAHASTERPGKARFAPHEAASTTMYPK